MPGLPEADPTKAAIADEVRSFIVRNFFFGDAVVSDDASLLGLGVVDSTGVLELVGFLETTYAIPIDDDDLVPENLDSVTRVVRFVTRKLRAVNHANPRERADARQPLP